MRTRRPRMLAVLHNGLLYELTEGHRVYWHRGPKQRTEPGVVERFTKKTVLIRLAGGEKKWVRSRSLMPRTASFENVD